MSGDELAPAHLEADEREAVAERKVGSAIVVYEVIRKAGADELARPASGLFFSALAAGIGVCASLIAVATLRAGLPDARWTELVAALGYTIGFVIVVLGNLQLFTEATMTAVLPVIAEPRLINVRRLVRLWGIVLAGNLAGTLIVAAMIAQGWIVDAETLDGALEFSSHLMENSFGRTLVLGIPAGFLIASLAWVLPNARESSLWVVVAITWLVSAGGFAHVVVGSAEAWLLWLSGRAGLDWVAFGFLLPAFLGNVIGGSGLFALIAHGQVKEEMEGGGRG
ncbi:transporter (formate/nitrite transporter family protein) [Sphingomonas spermidinifaciens]|uniref:Transporter (Formate/nitrite transporter family protein) n=1 Tax=Sphingomonas spermidinifaciens TaxID=1141889 RepID=A0A2A4B4V5_9SPHN|nr:formate/nitrite transporter family protein [Sphingomonas spermidinifaciens]PCD02778.1 transporter (formate/nitrite transporter family protein) [Sphingomonas spermidinifaciens]